MKLHEVEHVSGFGHRVAVPGGWLYDDGTGGIAYVPDSTAEHVTQGAGGAAAEAIYRDAADHCWKVVNEWAKRFGAPLLERAELHDALKALRLDGSTSQAGGAIADYSIEGVNDMCAELRDDIIRGKRSPPPTGEPSP